MRRRKQTLEALDQDIRGHLERETQDNVERGMPAGGNRYRPDGYRHKNGHNRNVPAQLPVAKKHISAVQ